MYICTYKCTYIKDSIPVCLIAIGFLLCIQTSTRTHIFYCKIGVSSQSKFYYAGSVKVLYEVFLTI